MGQAEALTGVSKRTLAAWVDRGVLKPTAHKGNGRGNGKHWSFSDLVGLRVIGDLRCQGISLQRVRKVIAKLRTLTGSDSNLQALASAKLVILPGNNVAVAPDAKTLRALLSGQYVMRGIVVVDVAPSLRAVEHHMQRAAKQDCTLQRNIAALKEERAWILGGKSKAA
jgi:DNA-binding transcriptional MerR regulator